MRTAESAINKPLLRWAGSKRRLLSVLRKCTPEFGKYIEPFAGSACLYFNLMPQRAILSDYNPELVQALAYLQHSPFKLFLALLRFPQTSSFYYKLRSMKTANLDDLDRAARFFYLNRFCFNGVYRTDRAGNFNVPRGTRTGKLLSLAEMRTFSNALKRAKILCRDFSEVIHDVQAGDFLYLDPPYAIKGLSFRGEYGSGAFSYADLPRLIDLLHAIQERGARFLLSYADDPELKSRCIQWTQRVVRVKRHIAGFSKHRRVVKELLIANYELPRL